MKKRQIKKLSLSRETLRRLQPAELSLAAGGAAAEGNCLTAAGCQTAGCQNGDNTESCVTCVVTNCSKIIAD